MGVIVTKGPAFGNEMGNYSNSSWVFGRSSSWMRSQTAVLDHDGEVEAIERQRCGAHGDPVEPREAWARHFPLAKSISGLNLVMLFPQRCLGSPWGGD